MTPGSHKASTLVAVPACNAGSYVTPLVERLHRVIAPESLLFVDDGSTDDTADQLTSLGVKLIQHRANKGKGAALKSAFRYALENGYRSVLTMDADLQHLPEEIVRLIELDDGHRIVIGCRMTTRDMPVARRLSNMLTSLIISILGGCRIRDSQCGFRLLPATLLRRLDLRSDGFDMESELLFRAGQLGYRVSEVSVTTIYDGSASNISHVGDTLKFIGLTLRRLFW